MPENLGTTLPDAHPAEQPAACATVTVGAGSPYVIGGVVAVAGLAWISAFGVAGIVDSGDVPLALYMLIIALASTGTLAAVVLTVAHLNRRAAAANAAAVLTAVCAGRAEIGTLAAHLEQVSAKVERINPMQIYANVMEDVLDTMRERP